MPTIAPQPAPPPRRENPTSTEVVHILKSVDWDHYWQKVSEKSSKEIEAYRIARAKSQASATRRVLV